MAGVLTRPVVNEPVHPRPGAHRQNLKLPCQLSVCSLSPPIVLQVRHHGRLSQRYGLDVKNCVLLPLLEHDQTGSQWGDSDLLACHAHQWRGLTSTKIFDKLRYPSCY